MKNSVKKIRDAFMEGAVAASKNVAQTKNETQQQFEKNYHKSNEMHESKDIRHKSRVDKYTLKEYNSFGWVRDNNMLTSNEYKNFTTEISKAVTSKAYSTDKTDLGEYMIPVGKMYGVNEGVKNKIVFAKGTIADPEITRIIEIDADNETDLTKIRSELYGAERQGIRSQNSGIFKVYSTTDYGYQSYQQRSGNGETKDNLQLGADRRTGSGATPKVKEYLFDDEGNIVSKTIRHKSRSTVTSGQYEQMKANLSHSKVYSKKSAMELVSRIAPGIRNRSFEAKSFYIPLINIKNAERPELSMVSPLSLYILSV